MIKGLILCYRINSLFQHFNLAKIDHFASFRPALKEMVAVAQLVEPRIVIPVVAGSSPVGHPTLTPCIY